MSYRRVAILAALNFLALSHFSNFRFDQVKSFNWDIALMLTPYGIIKNIYLENSHYLKPYYFKVMEIPETYSFFPVFLFIVVQWGLSFYLLENLKGNKS